MQFASERHAVDDVMAEFGPLADRVVCDDGKQIDQPAELLLNEVEQQVLQAIDNQPTSIDAIVAACSLPVHRVLSTVSVLEMRRLVRRTSGTQVVRTAAPSQPR